MSSPVFLRDEALLKLRPVVEFDAEKALPGELFQGKTLRPLLKFQNEWLLQQMQAYLKKRHKDFSALKPAARIECIEHAVKFDKLFRAELTGAIYALMTTSEVDYLFEHKPDVSKRLTQLLIERYVSQIDRLL